MARWVLVLVLCCVASPLAAAEKVIITSFGSPIKGTKWKVNSYKFGERCSYDTEKPGVTKDWGHHNGEDMDLPEGMVVVAAADGKVNFADVLPGTNRDQRSWGGVVVLGHWVSEKQAVYTLYGHIKIREGLKKGDFVRKGETIGTVAAGPSKGNGWWEASHLHFQINVDPLDTEGKGIMRSGLIKGYAQSYNKEGKLFDNPAPNRLADNVAPSEVLAAEDPVAFLRKAEADPKRKK